MRRGRIASRGVTSRWGSAVMRPLARRVGSHLGRALRVILAVVTLALLMPCALPVRANADTLFAQANALYTRGEYDSAALLYERIAVREGVSAPLYYNLGNTYYRQGDYARAILNYERALKYNPRHEDARFNLGLARVYTTDRFEGEGESVLQRAARGAYTLLSPRAWGWLTLLFLSLLLGSALLFRFTRRRAVIPLSVSIAALSLALGIVTLLLGIRAERALSESDQAIIMQSVVSAKSEPATGSKDLFLLHSGSKIGISQRLGEWVEIVLPDGHRGWVEYSTLEEI